MSSATAKKEETIETTTKTGGIAVERLRGFIDRIENLEEEKNNIGNDIKEVYGEAKSLGFDPKIMRKVISLRKRDPADRSEEQAILDTYLSALGME
jgi:uncharacterized protein (UPF0335 family)